MERKSAKWLLRYTVWYILIALGAYLVLFFDGKTVIWLTDGLMQVYGTLTYISDHVRAFFSTGRLTFDMVDLRLGQGMDVLACMGFYGLTDPLNLLAALTTGDGMEHLYAILIGLRLYLAGAAFGLYLRYALRAEGWATSLSALMYVFSGFWIFAAVRHPHFINGALYLPLILYGVEKLLREKKPHAMIGFTALMLITNFFFSFINTILAVLYILARLAFRMKGRPVAESAKDGFRLLGAYLLGLLISAAVFLPIVYNYTQNGRIGIETGYTASLIRYPLSYYVQYFLGFVAPAEAAGYWFIHSFAPIAWFCVLILLFKRGKTRRDAQILAGVIALLVFGAIPAVGKAFNAMGYVTNRWSYALALPVCAACAVALPELLRMEKRRLSALIALCALYLAAAAALAWRADKLMRYLPGYLIALSCLAGLRLLRAGRAERPALLGLLLSLALFSHAFCQYSPLVNDYADQFNKRGVYDRIMGMPVADALGLDDESVYRATTPDLNDAYSSQIGYLGVSYYWSLIPEWTAQYQLDVMLSTRSNFHNLHGLDARTSLSALAGIKYFLLPDGKSALLPYGSELVAETERADIYQNPYALPLGYVYDRVLPASLLEGLSPLDRQQAYAQFAVLDGDAAAPAGAYESAVAELPFTLSAGEGMALEASRLAAQKGGTLNIAFDAPAGHEVYVMFDGILMTCRQNGTVAVTTTAATGSGRTYLTTPKNSLVYEQKGLLVNLGCADQPMTGCSMVFENACTLAYESLRVLCLPIQSVTDAIGALAARPLEHIAVSPNRIAGDVSLEAPGVLQISVPYGAGWTAAVNGQATETLRVGGMYLGVSLPAGDHAIALTYRTPYLLEGACVSAGALLLWGVIALAGRRRRGA